MKKIFTTILSLLLIAKVTVANSASTEELFIQGNNYVLNQRPESALRIYKSMEDRGVTDAKLFGNMAIAFFKTGKKTQAILYAERSLARAPFDAKLASNFKLIKPDIENREKQLIKNLWKSLAFKKEILMKCTLISFLISAIVFMLYSFGLSRKLKLLHRSCFCIFLVFSIICGISFAGEILNSEALILVKTKGHSGPSDAASVVLSLAEAEKVDIVNQFETWLKVENTKGQSAWIRSSALARIN